MIVGQKKVKPKIKVIRNKYKNKMIKNNMHQ